MQKVKYYMYIKLVLVLVLVTSGGPPPPPDSKSGLQFPPPLAASPTVPVVPGMVAVAGMNYAASQGTRNGDGECAGAYAIRPGGEDPLAYALYTFDNLGLNRPVSLALTIVPAKMSPGGEDELPLIYWIGLSNFTDNSWQWMGPYSEAQTLTLNGAGVNSRYISAAAKFSVAIACDSAANGTCGAEIRTGILSTLQATSPDYVCTKPCSPPTGAALASTGAVALSWTNVLDPVNNGVNAASSYEVYRKSGTDTLLIGTIAAPNSNYIDPANNNPGVPGPTAGSTYVYSVRAVNTAGATPQRSWVPVTVLQ